MVSINKESYSGIIYKGVQWGNYYSNTDQWLTSIYEVELKNSVKPKPKYIVTVLVGDTCEY